ncbi:hypothetical protein POTOM_043942 [Populus tomentosa]|uniref:Uncharacterized protein n=1 Tax=Populus tomentosa TaxID=118781 RepID=A0A8X7YFA6_POPTO|nr:hypothetical protein POTOM_043942 [Populus tomentosa]
MVIYIHYCPIPPDLSSQLLHISLEESLQILKTPSRHLQIPYKGMVSLTILVYRYLLDNPFGSLLSFLADSSCRSSTIALLSFQLFDLYITLYTFQRFGSGSVSTHFLGAALLRGEWESAASKILDPRDVMRKAREYYEERTNLVVLGDLVYCKGEMIYRKEDIIEVKPRELIFLKGKIFLSCVLDALILWQVVTTEDRSTGSYTVDDVVLSMPGSRVSVGLSLEETPGKALNVVKRSMPMREFLTYNDSNKPLEDTDLHKISKVRSMNIIKKDEQLKGDEDENSSDCTKQPLNSQNGTGLSTDTNEVESEREVGCLSPLKLYVCVCVCVLFFLIYNNGRFCYDSMIATSLSRDSKNSLAAIMGHRMNF